jgi:hypothetical protein
MLATDAARANLLTNGGFEIWQRGNGPFSTNAIIGADCWYVSIFVPDTLAVSKNTANADINGSCAACVYTRSVGNSSIYQVVRKAEQPKVFGKSVSISVRVSCATANAVRLSVVGDGTGAVTTNSSFHDGSGVYTTLSVVYVAPSDGTYIQILIQFSASCTAYIDNAMLVVGSVPADYAPLHPADDLARCQRYYETPSSVFHMHGYSGAGGPHNLTSIYFRTVKSVSPTMTIVGTPTYAGTGSPSALIVSNTNTFLAHPSISAGGVGEIFVAAQWNAEANP